MADTKTLKVAREIAEHVCERLTVRETDDFNDLTAFITEKLTPLVGAIEPILRGDLQVERIRRELARIKGE